MNTVYLLFRLARESNYVTVLSESTVVGEDGLHAIPISDTDTPENVMQGCIHLLKGAYVKNSTREFVRMLGESTSVLRHTLL
jgi:LysR family cyn operon transcriptional activator